MNKAYDWIVIGGGFRSILGAYARSKAGESVLLVEAGNSIGGFFKPIKWDEFWLDKGPQFFDNFQPADRAYFDEMLGDDMLQDIGFSYKSHMNGVTTDGYAIPDWRAKGAQFTSAAFADILQSRIAMMNQGQTVDDLNISSMQDLIRFEGGEVLYDDLCQMAQKFLRTAPDQISLNARNMVTFCGRKVLCEQDAAIDLKSAPMIDAFLAAQKVGISDERYNLYPKGSNLEKVRLAMERALDRVGVDVMIETSITSWDADASKITLSSGDDVGFGKIFAGSDIRITEEVLYGTDTLAQSTRLLPEIFHCFAVPADQVDESFYIVDYDLDHLSSRMTNFSNFMGSDSSEGLGVICIEQPIDKGSPEWDTPDMNQDAVFAEAQAVGNVRCETYAKAKSFRVPVTYKVPLVGLEERVDAFRAKADQAFGDKIIVPDAYTLTRKETIDDLASLGIL